jgi:hypothetical protein
MTAQKTALAGTAGADKAPAAAVTGNAVARRGDLVVIPPAPPRLERRPAKGVRRLLSRAGHQRHPRRAGPPVPARRHLPLGERLARRPGKGQPLPSLFERAAIKSQKEVDVPGALVTAACHVWPGHEDHVRGYATLTEVRAALRPHLLESAGWEQLRDAAAAWEAARRKARPLLSAAVRAHGAEFRRLSDLYDAAVTAANDAYRAQHGQAAETGSAAA